MHLDINLLPDNKKTRLEKLIKFIFIKELLEIILLISVFLAMLFLFSSMTIQDQFTGLTQSALLINKDFSSYNQDIKNTNLLIRKVNLASSNFTTIGDKIVYFSQNVPADIKISSMEIDRQKGIVVISGIAKTRESLLLYQDKLRQYDWLKNIEAPTSQLFQKENISFEIHAETKNIPLIEPIQSAAKPADQE